MANRDITNDASNPDKSAPVIADKLPIVDTGTTPNSLKEITLENLMKFIALLTADASPAGGDSVVSYDASAAANKQVLLSNLHLALTYATAAQAITGTSTTLPINPANLRAVLETAPDGTMFNLKLNVSVQSNDLVVQLLSASGGTPSATDPGFVKINGTVRTVNALTSMTLADATNWYGSGVVLAGLEADYFAYAVWDSNSSVVAVSAARVPFFRLVSNASSTTTNDRYLGNYADFTSTDDVCVIGRFAATLSAAAGHVWTVPTFTNLNLAQHPIFFTRRLVFLAAPTGYSAVPTTTAYEYYIQGQLCYTFIREAASGTSNATTLTWSAPVAAATLTNMVYQGIGNAFDNSAALTTPVRMDLPSASSTVTCYTTMSAASAWTGSGAKRIAQGTLIYGL